MGRHVKRQVAPNGATRVSGPRRAAATVGLAMVVGGTTLLTQGCGGGGDEVRSTTPPVAAAASPSPSLPPPTPTPTPTPSLTQSPKPSAKAKPSVKPSPSRTPSATKTRSRAPAPTVRRTTSPPKARTGAPLSLSAPTIGVRQSMRRISAVDGVVNPPAGSLAWIRGYGRVRPGERGTAVIAGHVVRGRSPDVFYDLQTIRRGHKVTVFDAAGKPVVYTVTATRVATKQAVSRDRAVWGANSSVRRIALITCDDDDGFRADGHRVSNFVAIAEAR